MLSERSPRIAAAHRLLRRSRRTETGEFLAEGAPAVTEAVAYAREHPGEVLELFITEAAAAKHVRLVRAAFAAKVEVTQVTEKAAAALSDAITPQGIVVRCAHPQTTVADVLAGSPKLVVVLVRANDPGNAGTVIRLADAAGADGVILAGDSVDAFNPKAIRASAGSLFHLPVARAADESALLDELSAAVCPCWPPPAPPNSILTPRAPTGFSTCRPRGCSGRRRTACRTRWSRAPTRPCGCRSTAAPSRSTWPVLRRSASTRAPPAPSAVAAAAPRRAADARPAPGVRPWRQRQPYRCRSRASTAANAAGGRPAVSRRIPSRCSRNTRSMFTHDGRPAESQFPDPIGTNSALPWCDFDVSCTAR